MTTITAMPAGPDVPAGEGDGRCKRGGCGRRCSATRATPGTTSPPLWPPAPSKRSSPTTQTHPSPTPDGPMLPICAKLTLPGLPATRPRLPYRG